MIPSTQPVDHSVLPCSPGSVWCGGGTQTQRGFIFTGPEGARPETVKEHTHTLTHTCMQRHTQKRRDIYGQTHTQTQGSTHTRTEKRINASVKRKWEDKVYV